MLSPRDAEDWIAFILISIGIVATSVLTIIGAALLAEALGIIPVLLATTAVIAVAVMLKRSWD